MSLQRPFPRKVAVTFTTAVLNALFGLKKKNSKKLNIFLQAMQPKLVEIANNLVSK